MEETDISKELLASLRKVRPPLPGPAAEQKQISKLKEKQTIPIIEWNDSLSCSASPKIFVPDNFMENKEFKSEDSLSGIIPRTKQSKKMITSDLWYPYDNGEWSNWDQFYESHTEATENRKVAKIGTDDSDWDIIESCSSTPMTSQKQIGPQFSPLRKDHMFISFATKTGMRYITKNILTPMKEISEWLNEGNSPQKCLPVSFNKLTDDNLYNLHNYGKKTIVDAVEDFNPSKQGLTFFLGPVNGKLSYKMTVCDLDKLRYATGFRDQQDDKKT